MLPDNHPEDRTLDPDAALMTQAAEGSMDAFADLARRHQNNLLNFFVRMGAYYHEAEDMVQETLLRVFKYRDRYQPTAKFTTFLYVLARHVWADRGRQAGRWDRLHAQLKSDAEIVEGVPGVAPGNRLDVQEALDRLSPKLREVLVLNIYQGMRYQEIADVLGVPLGTVKSRINLALKEMRERLDDAH